MSRDGPRYTTQRLKEIWSPEATKGTAFRLWHAHLNWMHRCGWGNALKVESTNAARLTHFDGNAYVWEKSGHEVVDLLREFVRETGLVNAHAGLTSSDIVDNVRLIQCSDSVAVIRIDLKHITEACRNRLGMNVHGWCLGYTHWRPASRLTWNRRVSAWLAPLDRALSFPPAVRAKQFGGATGTSAAIKILQDEGAHVPFDWRSFGLHPPSYFTIQSSDHHSELECAHWLSAVAGQLHKVATDMRFLVHTGELRMGRSIQHRGSSSMPLKINPIEAEKICALTRMVPGCYRTIWDCLAHNGLERTLDTSAALKETLPRMFGLVGAALITMQNFVSVTHIDEGRCKALLTRNLRAATVEETMAQAIKEGKSRMEVYEGAYNDNEEDEEEGDPGPSVDQGS